MSKLSPDQREFMNNATGGPNKIEWWSLEYDRYDNGGANLYAFGTYPRSSVLAGQEMKMFVAGYASMDEAEAANPGVDKSNRMLQAGNTYDHLGDNFEDEDSLNHFNDGEY